MAGSPDKAPAGSACAQAVAQLWRMTWPESGPASVQAGVGQSEVSHTAVHLCRLTSLPAPQNVHCAAKPGHALRSMLPALQKPYSDGCSTCHLLPCLLKVLCRRCAPTRKHQHPSGPNCAQPERPQLLTGCTDRQALGKGGCHCGGPSKGSTGDGVVPEDNSPAQQATGLSHRDPVQRVWLASLCKWGSRSEACRGAETYFSRCQSWASSSAGCATSSSSVCAAS